MTAQFETKDSGQRQQFSSGMVRDVSEGKTRFDLLIPLLAERPMLIRWAELLTRGAVKYEARNWELAKTLQEGERFRESAFRHFMQWYLGEDDEDHAAAVFFNVQGAEYVRERL